MDTVTVLWCFCGAFALLLGATCGFLWLVERQDRASLMLSILGIAAGLTTYFELGLMHATTAAEYGDCQHWYYVPTAVAIIAQVLFVHYYLGTGNRWLLGAIILIRSILLVVNLSVYPSVNFLRIVSLRQMSFFGEQVSVIGVAVVRTPWQGLALVSLVLWMIYPLDAVVRRWRKGDRDSRRKALAVGLGVGIPLLVNIVHSQLVVFGIVQCPITNLWFLGTLSVMAYELARDVVRSRRAQLELAELRCQVAQLERVNMLGLLAAALAHELAQPLAAISANVGAAQRYLRHEKPELAELRTAIDDIDKDDRRATDIIHRLRQLFKQRAIEMQPLDVADVVQNIVALARSEAAARHVVLALQLPPGLPRVFGDRVHLSQVLLNLVLNGIHAVQSRPRDARRILVVARADDANDQVEIAVQDSGPGVPANLAEEVFKPYFSTKPEGMGVGLALSRCIIAAHGGRLWSDQLTKRNGATFRFTLRRA
jgi:signal transduction histidine kinase